MRNHPYLGIGLGLGDPTTGGTALSASGGSAAPVVAALAPGGAVQIVEANSQYLYNDNAAGLFSVAPGGSLTVAAAVRMDSLVTDRHMVVMGCWITPDNGEWQLAWNHVNQLFHLEIQSAAGGAFAWAFASNLGVPVPGVWYYLMAWMDGTNHLHGISVNNGTANEDSYSAGIYNLSTPLWVGAGSTLTTDARQFWDGAIDVPAVWSRMLTPTERTFLYNGGNLRRYTDLTAGLLVGLVDWWEMDEDTVQFRNGEVGNDLIPVNAPARVEGKT